MLTKIKTLDVNSSATIEVVEKDGAQTLILKTCEPYDVVVEHAFIETLRQNNLPHLEYFVDTDLQSEQLLLEYVEGSPTLATSKTPEMFEKWGKLTRRIHDVHSDKAMRICEDSSLKVVAWHDYIQETYKTGVTRNDSSGAFGSDTIEKIGRLVERLITLEVAPYSLIHGDLHSSNVLIRDGSLVIFDKGEPMLYGDPMYDLAIFMINFGFSDDNSDHQLMNAFIKGYEEDFVKTRMELLELNTLLRAFKRHGNKFEPQTGMIISKLLAKYA